MSLPAGQQRVLRSMERGLQASEPRLASMFAMFARLNQGEPIRAESLRCRTRLASWGAMPIYAVAVIAIMFAVIAGALIGGTARGAITCGSPHQAGGASLVSRPACALAAKSAPGKTASPAPGADRRSCTARPAADGAFPQIVPADAATPRPPATC